MKDIIILGIPLLILVVLYLLSFEKRLKTNSYLLIATIVISLGYGGYLLGSADEFAISRIVLIILFFGGGLWRLIQFSKLKMSN